jgi:hypothetical protein
MVSVIPECEHTIINTPHRDTVSSVGIQKEKILPSTDTCNHICYFRHALALDERRVKFLPEYVYGSMSDRSGSKSVPPPKDECHLKEDHAEVKDNVKEVWFAGSHADVYVFSAPEGYRLRTCSSGGGQREKTDNVLTLRDMPLLWMREEAVDLGLRLNPPEVAFTSEDLKEPKITNSLTLPWWVLEIMPIKRLRYNKFNQHTQM